jgi:phage gp45-like
MMAQVWRRLQLLAAQGRATLVGAQTVQVQVLEGEVLKAQRIEPYGLSYRPKPGAQAYLVFPGGDRAMGLALVVGDKRYQVELAEGEVALHDDEGNFVKLGRGGVVTAKASAQIVLDAPAVLVTGAVTMLAGLAVTGGLTNNGKNVGHTHAHDTVKRGTDVSGGVI